MTLSAFGWRDMTGPDGLHWVAFALAKVDNDFAEETVLVVVEAQNCSEDWAEACDPFVAWVAACELVAGEMAFDARCLILAKALALA